MFAVAHRSQIRGTTSKSLFASIQAAREQVPPQAHAALAATVETRIAVTRVFRCALEAAHQAVVSIFQSASHAGIPHSELPQRARGFLAEDVACGCRRDTLTRKQDNALGTFGGKSGKCACVGPGQPLASDDPPCGLTAFSRREPTAAEVRGIDGVDGLRKTGPVDQQSFTACRAARCPQSPEIRRPSAEAACEVRPTHHPVWLSLRSHRSRTGCGGSRAA